MIYDNNNNINNNNINNNINQTLDNSFIFCNDLNRTNYSVPYGATKLTNLNKAFYLRTNRSNFENMQNLNNFDNNHEKFHILEINIKIKVVLDLLELKIMYRQMIIKEKEKIVFVKNC